MLAMDVAQPPSVAYLMFSQMIQAVVSEGGREGERENEIPVYLAVSFSNISDFTPRVHAQGFSISLFITFENPTKISPNTVANTCLSHMVYLTAAFFALLRNTRQGITHRIFS